MYRSHILSCIVLAAASIASGQESTQFNPCSYAKENVLVRDVVVIGGGASGTYGAIALKDMGRSVVVVEKQPHFGGHVNTYNDPTTGLALDYGVQAYENDTITQAFFSRFNIPLIPLGAGSGQLVVDFKTGLPVTTAFREADLTKYAELTNKYYPDPALGLDLPSPVPADVLLPFRDFIKKYSLENVAYSIWSFTSPANNLLDQLTVYAFLGCNTASSPLLGGHGAAVWTRNNSELFGKAEAEFASSKNALLSSQVIAGKRSNENGLISLVVQTPTSKKLILASQVLFSAPIVLDNLTPFDLDKREQDLFSQIYYTAWYTALVTDTGLKPGYVYENADNDTLYNIPIEPYTFRIGATKSPSTFFAFYGAMTDLPEKEVKAKITESIQILSGSKSTTPPRFLAFSSHTPFKQQVSKEAVADGFYDKLNALQSYRGMHYTGNALDASGSSSLWNFTRHLLPGIERGIEANKMKPGVGVCNNRRRY